MGNFPHLQWSEKGERQGPISFTKALTLCEWAGPDPYHFLSSEEDTQTLIISTHYQEVNGYEAQRPGVRRTGVFLPVSACVIPGVEPRVALGSPDESVSQQFLPWSPVVSDIFLRKPFMATWPVAVASVTVTIASRTLFGCLGSLLCLQVLSLSVAGQPSSLFQYQIYR